MEETAISVSRSCRKCRVKRKVRLNKLSHAHLAGFIVSSLWSLACITQMLLILDFMERKRGGWGLVACQHFLCLCSTERAKDEEEEGGLFSRRGCTVIVTYISAPLLIFRPSKFVFLWDFPLFSPQHFQSPQLWNFCFWEAILASDCVHQCLSWLNLCLNSADHHHCVGKVFFFYWLPQAFRSICTVWAKSSCFSLFTWPSVF